MSNRIFILSTFGDLTKKSVVGGHSRKIIYVLSKFGYDVVPINRKSPFYKNIHFAKAYILFWGIIAMISFICKIMFASRKQSLTLNISYCGSMMPFDAMTVIVAKKLGFRHVLYIKGGRAKKSFEKGSKTYKWLFRKAIEDSRMVFTEGEENVALCNSLCNTEVVYIPNYTEEGFAPEKLPTKPSDKWNFLYFGRICDDKNVELVIDIFDEICKTYQNCTLQLIGKGDSSYLNMIDCKINNSPNKDSIKRLQAIDHDKLKLVLQDSHFFIFPSREPNEGHSNSLNEAMVFGLVPISSSNNFLPAIVGCDDLVAKQDVASEYSEIVNRIISSNSFDYYSNMMHKRVIQNFTQKQVEGKIANSISNLFSAK